jgi:nucleoporin-like protein 2
VQVCARVLSAAAEVQPVWIWHGQQAAAAKLQPVWIWHGQQQQQPSSNPFGFGTGSKQQQPSSSPSGVGTGSMQQQPSFGSQFQQQQPQKPNPFGFGVQGGSAQSRNAPGPAKVCVSVGGMELVLTTHSQFLIECVLLVLVCDQWILSNQPFQNKWVRDPSAPTKQSEAAQPPPTAHT